MPKREDDIRNEIQRLDDQIFERFAIELLSRDLYPGLNPTSRTHDLGEDARSEPSTIFLNEDKKWISLAVSKQSNWKKVKEDCIRCQETGRHIDILVFVTSGDPRNDTVEGWKASVKRDFNWELEVRSINFLAPFASRPRYESLVDDYLHIPPPGGDYINDIEKKISNITQRYLSQIDMTVPGMSTPLSREEVNIVEEQLVEGRQIILSGEAGTGKSGIAAILTKNALSDGSYVLFLDGRLIGNFGTEGELRNFFDLKGSISLAISRIDNEKGCRVIIDQLDNIAGSDSARLVKEIIAECLKIRSDLQIVIVCRNKEQHESSLLRDFISLGFIEIICREINIIDVKSVLKAIGIDNYSSEVIELGRNLLNLSLIGQIHKQDPDFDFTNLTDEILLWEGYILSWANREGSMGEEMIREATQMSLEALNNPEGIFEVSMPASPAVKRLISWGIVYLVEGYMYRFQHDKFQDYLYARYAADRLFLPKTVLSEILEYKTSNVFTWMNAIYAHRRSSRREEFLKELFNVG